MSVKRCLIKLQSYSDELGLNLSKSGDRFKWFLASVLFAKRISAKTVLKRLTFVLNKKSSQARMHCCKLAGIA
jgi:hypothetical protein